MAITTSNDEESRTPCSDTRSSSDESSRLDRIAIWLCFLLLVISLVISTIFIIIIAVCTPNHANFFIFYFPKIGKFICVFLGSLIIRVSDVDLDITTINSTLDRMDSTMSLIQSRVNFLGGGLPVGLARSEQPNTHDGSHQRVSNSGGAYVVHVKSSGTSEIESAQAGAGPVLTA
jgi:hypothetical protein